MKVCLDTNVPVAGSVRQHPHFQRADAVMEGCMERLVNWLRRRVGLFQFAAEGFGVAG
jgi:predicted nucleic acid-binding protein